MVDRRYQYLSKNECCQIHKDLSRLYFEFMPKPHISNLQVQDFAARNFLDPSHCSILRFDQDLSDLSESLFKYQKMRLQTEYFQAVFGKFQYTLDQIPHLTPFYNEHLSRLFVINFVQGINKENPGANIFSENLYAAFDLQQKKGGLANYFRAIPLEAWAYKKMLAAEKEHILYFEESGKPGTEEIIQDRAEKKLLPWKKQIHNSYDLTII